MIIAEEWDRVHLSRQCSPPGGGPGIARMFLAIDKEKEGFLPREGIYGKDPVG